MFRISIYSISASTRREEVMNRIDKPASILSRCISSLGFWIAIMEGIIFHLNLCPGNQLYIELDSSPFASPLEESKQIKMKILNVMISRSLFSTFNFR